MRIPLRISASAAALWTALVAGGAPGAQPVAQEGTEAAVVALSASVDVERELLRGHQEQYRRSIAERDAASRRLQQALTDLDALVQRVEGFSLEQIAVKDREVVDAERQRMAAMDRARAILDRIGESAQRIEVLERKVAGLRETLPKPKETLSGGWQVTYLPGAQKGVFFLRQSGTIVQGQYHLDGGWSGSLQGTFVDGKVYLQRIDSKLGRSSELQGFLAPDGKTIRGTWQNYNLTDGGASAGSWTASRQEDQ